MSDFDRQSAIARFVERRVANKGTRTNNTAAYAGSPMVYHCRHCEAHTEPLPEAHRQVPRTLCEGCKELVDHGCLGEAEQAYVASVGGG